MLKEKFGGRNPSHFVVNPIVKAYIISESFLWSAWDLVIPIFSIYVVDNVQNGTIQTAAAGYSMYLVSRVIFELISGRFLTGSNDKKKLMFTLAGMLCITGAYMGFAFSQTILPVFACYALAGLGLGIASPAKNSLFAMHLDKNKESTEWSIADAAAFICMALATALGGFIAMHYGFQMLFFIAALISLLATIPYLLYLSD